MTGKERAALRAQANTMEPLFQVGKGGISPELIKQVDDALTARELIKLKVLLETTPEPPKEIARKLAEATHAEVIGVIGGSMIFYRYSKKLHEKKKVEVKPLYKKKAAMERRIKREKEAERQRRNARFKYKKRSNS